MNQNTEKEPFYKALLQRIKNATDYGDMDGLCTYAHFNTDSLSHVTTAHEYTMEGTLFVLISRGTLAVRHNQKQFSINGPSYVALSPGSSISLGNVDSIEGEIYILYLSKTFLQDLNISLGFFPVSGIQIREHPGVELTDKELSQLLRYIKIISNVLDDDFNLNLNRHLLSSLVSSFIYQNMIYYFKRISATVIDHVPSRRNTYVHEFLKLVHLNYTRERSVIFYAGKLCISPKYLSIMVKESTGKSAAQWIDQFVIMEAKNLLRFSGKNVQQVAYALNFINQSAFGKYFKHLTGMSPTEYQKSN